MLSYRSGGGTLHLRPFRLNGCAVEQRPNRFSLARQGRPDTHCSGCWVGLELCLDRHGKFRPTGI